MNTRLYWPLAVLCAGSLLSSCNSNNTNTSTPPAGQSTARYGLANACYAMQSDATHGYVHRSGDAWVADGSTIAEAEPFYMKPSGLGTYLLYTSDSSFLTANPAAGSLSVTTARTASPDSDWTVNTDQTGAFVLNLPSPSVSLVASSTHQLGLAQGASGGNAGRFSFQSTKGCADFPEIEVDSTGTPFTGNGVDKPVLGFADSHVHVTATDFLGHAHGGRPFHPYGVTQALGSCEDRHGIDGTTDFIGNFVTTGKPFGHHDTRGWPTFKDWPAHGAETHEATYYKWLERAWRSGERIMVNFLVENETLCSLNAPLHGLKNFDCNEMDSVRLQVQQIHDLQDYIDAQEGGPGKGWFRIVTSPAEARSVINDGKLAVILGIETSHLFDCPEKDGVGKCTESTIDSELDEFYNLGVRTVFPMHEFDNAYGGNGIFYPFLDAGNLLDTGRLWTTYNCPDEPYLYGAGASMPPHPYAPTPDEGLNSILENLHDETPPVVGSSNPNQCNKRWITPLGTYLIQRLMEKRMIIEIDHMELGMKGQVIAMAEAQKPVYPVMSSHGGHGGISMDQAQRIINLGGLIFPYKGNGEDYANFLPVVSKLQNPNYYFAVGFGADTNGMAPQAGPRNDNKPVSYPFTLYKGDGWGPDFANVAPVSFDHQRSGVHSYDTDVDGFAHYGMMADFVEEVRIEGGQPATDALFHSAEAYLEMWERVENR